MPELLDVRFSFFCRTSHKDKEGRHPIILRITFRGGRRDIFTGLYCSKEDWDSDTSRVLKTDKEAVTKNRNLDTILRKTNDVFDSFRFSGEVFNIDQVVERLKGKDQDPELLIDCLEEGVKKIFERVGVEITQSCYYKYRRSLKYMQEFLVREYKVKNYTLNKINSSFLEKFFHFLRKEKNIGHNTSLKYLTLTKSILYPASGGTILLDEIGEISPETQAKLLRVLQEKEIQRVGSNAVIKTNVRILAATSRILEKEVAEGRFRLDLYYRLLVFPITLPPLRERKDDIPLLVDYFIQYYSKKTGKKISAFHPDTIQRLLQYNWPGNVRELQHVIERSILLSNDEIVHEITLPALTPILPGENKKDKHIKTLEEIERDHILTVLNQCNFRITGRGGAAEVLNLPPGTLNS